VGKLKARTADGEFALLIEAMAWEQVERLCVVAGDHETGGILIGRYTPDRTTAVVSEVTPAPDYSRCGRWTFIRGVAGLRELLRRRWHGAGRTYYLGEWHYHPAEVVEPSSDDTAQMVQIANAGNYESREPIMVIVGRHVGDQDRRHVRVFVFPDGRQIEMQVGSPLPRA